ncbi:hypothetical protein HY003_04155 [Candidatus Saccharibacteria bacterium]|nr:hypothetical protein [Candidatus Saccharibacteria bacterium]MBI3338462.1 hypothetical protein [Candidatus Saccharibacteria bacterium]
MIAILLYTIAFIDFCLALLVLKNNIKNMQNIFFAYFVVAGSLWSTGDALMLFAKQSYLTDIGAKLFVIAPVYTTLFLVFFTSEFVGKVNRKFLHVSAIYLALLITGVSIFRNNLFVLRIDISSIQNSIVFAQPGYYLYTLYFSLYLSYVSFLLWQHYRSTMGYKKTQINYIFIAVFSASLVSGVTNLLLPNFGISSFVWAGPLSTVFFAIMIFVAIVRHKLFDIRLVVARSLAYLLLISTIALVSGTLIVGVAINLLGSTSFNTLQQVFLIASSLLLGIMFPPLKRFFDKTTNRFFYRDAYDERQFLDEFSNILVSTIDTNVLLKNCVEVIETNLKSDFAVFSLHKTTYIERRTIGSVTKRISDEQERMLSNLLSYSRKKVIVADELEGADSKLRAILESNNIRILVRIVAAMNSKKEGIGYLMLGQKKSGNPYSKQDIHILEIIANELVIAIQNALRFEEIENFNLTLQQKMENATQQLRNTNNKLKMMDETKDEFISMASHQLRTPLTSVKGYLSMVLEGDVGPLNVMQRKLLDQAFISSQRMVYLIADLLNVSRLRTGKFIIEVAPTNLAEVVEGEVNQLKATAKSRQLTLTYEKPKNFPILMFDETKIRQVIMNFIDNAIYYTPAGGEIKVSLSDTDKTIEYIVTDNGIGVPKHEQHHLFGKFFRATNAKKTRPDGTGLGLFMAKKAIVAQGGSIIFRSQEGKGSTFGFSFAKRQNLPVER